MLFFSPAVIEPPPVARIVVSSPVQVGESVTYRDLSFDPAPGHVIIFRWWIGREPSFSSAGDYLVQLWVEDDRGLWAFTSANVEVMASRPSPPPQPSWAVEGPSDPVPRGGATIIKVTGHPPGALHLVVPASFQAKVDLEGQTVDYGALNSRPLSPSQSSEEGVLYVPWTQTQPQDGTYRIGVTDGSMTEYVQVTVEGTLNFDEPVRTATNGP